MAENLEHEDFSSNYTLDFQPFFYKDLDI